MPGVDGGEIRRGGRGRKAREARAQSQRLILALVGQKHLLTCFRSLRHATEYPFEANMLRRTGRDSVSGNDLQQLEILAKSYPMVDGQAVYKARTLYAYYEPGLTYHDFEDCNLANKGGTAPYQNILQFLHESQQNHSSSLAQEPGSIVIYPNPSSGIVQIKHTNQNSGVETIALFDIAGRIITEHQILFSNGHASINFENLSPGMYTCKIGNGNSAFYAKLIIATP